MHKDVIKRIIENDPFLKHIGIRVDALTVGKCRLSVDFKTELTRYGGVLNGGAIATLADAAGGCAMLTLNEGRNQVTTELGISFLNPITNGPVRAEGEVLKQGKHISVAEVKIFDGKDRLCALAKGSWFFIGELK